MGVAILMDKVKTFDVIKTETISSRLMYIDIKTENCEMRIINVYAPNKGHERKQFLKNNVKHYIRCNVEIIVGGDFNCTISDLDCKRTVVHVEGSEELIDIMKSFECEDVARKRQPNKLIYTYHRPNGEEVSHINMCLISKELDHSTVDVSTDWVPIVPYHKAAKMTIETSQSQRGEGRWKINDRVISSDLFRETFMPFWVKWKTQQDSFNDQREWCEESKRKIKELTISCARILKRQEEREVKDFQQRQDSCEDEAERYKILKQLDDLYAIKANGARIRAREKSIEHGEKPTKYFHGLEKTCGQQKMWKCVKNKNGDVVEGIGNILKRQVEYYEELYTSHSIHEVEANTLLQNVTRTLTREQAEQLEKTITVSECEKCICSLQNESSSGLDGITNSFYKTYFNVIGEDLTEVINEVLDKGECCPSQYMGIIILHYKAGEREILNNWRPITLLNVDYKIIERVLAARLKKILPYIVDDDQKGYVDKRNISDA